MMLFSNLVYADANTVTVVADYCYVYETAAFDSPLLQDEKPVKFTHGQKLSVLEDKPSLDFIKVEVEGAESGGYVYRYYVTYSDVTQEIYPVFNGKIVNDNVKLYDLDKKETSLVAKKGQKVYLYNGYNGKEEFNAIAIKLDDGSLFYGYVKTADVEPYGVNAGLITGIVVIASCLTIIFLLLFMKKKKRQ